MDELMDSYFNPRAPCGARRQMEHGSKGKSSISTHAPLAGRDVFKGDNLRRDKAFQPTRPLRGATMDADVTGGVGGISTHAPLAGRDRNGARAAYMSARFQPTRPLRGATNPRHQRAGGRCDFNPRAPCGARPLTHRSGYN